MGYFYAESLLLFEPLTTGAIQIAGTDALLSFPSLLLPAIALMGEELYAASAYLSREPKLLGSLKGQDAGKAIISQLVGCTARYDIPFLTHVFAH